jgi:hypothetical protein
MTDPVMISKKVKRVVDMFEEVKSAEGENVTVLTCQRFQGFFRLVAGHT